MIKVERSHLCVKFLQGPQSGDLMASGRGKKRGGDHDFCCVAENAEGGVRSHPAVINYLAVRNTEMEEEMWGRTK